MSKTDYRSDHVTGHQAIKLKHFLYFILKKSNSKSDKLLQQIKQTTIVLPKINKVFLSPILQDLNGS